MNWRGKEGRGSPSRRLCSSPEPRPSCVCRLRHKLCQWVKRKRGKLIHVKARMIISLLFFCCVKVKGRVASGFMVRGRVKVKGLG